MSFSLFNCSEDNPVDPVTVDSSDFRYPFKDGSSWSYKMVTTATDIRPDSIQSYVNSIYPYEVTGTARILYDTVINSVTTKCFIDEFTLNGTLRTNRYYYINNDTSLILYKSKPQGPPTGILPLRRNKLYSIFEKDNFHLSGTDSLKSTLKYPMTTGTQWSYHIENFFPPYDIVHKYLGFENVSTPAGVFSCIKELTTLSLFPELYYYNYYSKQGLVKTEWIYNDSPVTTIKNPEGIGTADIVTELHLISYTIPQ